MFKRGATVQGETPYLVERRFTVADIIVGYTVNWGARDGAGR